MKACVLTGAGGAIGGAIAHKLTASGWRVLGIDLAFPDDPASPLGERVVCDITDETMLRGCLRELADAEPVRGLVNCAGFYPVESFADSDSVSWRRQVDVNFLAPVIACHTVLPAHDRSGVGTHREHHVRLVPHGRRTTGGVLGHQGRACSASRRVSPRRPAEPE